MPVADPSIARRSSLTTALTLLTWLLITIIAALPIAWMVLQLVAHPGVLADLRLSGFRARLLGRTLAYNAAVAAIAILLGIPAAIVVGRGRGALAGALSLLLPLPLLLPSITYAYGWSQYLRLRDVFLEPASRGDVSRCIWTLATWLWVVPAGVIGLSLRQLDQSLQQQALLDGAYWRVTARQLAGPAVAAFCMVMVLAMQEFAVYEPTGISVAATEIRAVFETGVINLPPSQLAAVVGGAQELPRTDQPRRAAAALATALPMFVAITLVAALAVLMVRGNTVSDQVDAGPWPAVLRAGPLPTVLSIAVMLVTVGVPTFCLCYSLKRKPDPSRIWHTYSPQVIGSLGNAALAGAVGIALALLSSLRRFSGALPIALMAFLAGGELLAIAEIRLYNRASLWWIYNGPIVVVLAYLARFGWIALLAGRGTWSKPWRELREMAAVDGADAFHATTRVVWPLAWPIAVAAGVLVMVLSLTEVPATVILAPVWPPVLVPFLMTWLHQLRSDDMIEASLLLMAAATALGLMATLLIRFGWRAVSRRAPLVLACALVLPVLGGCHKSSRPDAVWLETGAGEGQVVYPRGIAYSPKDDTLFVVDRMARVQHFNRKGEYLNGWRMPHWELGKPVGLSVGPDGNLWVPDTHYHRVVVYTPQGQALREWGSLGTEPGQFIYPTDIAFDSAGRVFVSEYGDHDRIQVFTPEGRFLYQFGRFGNGDGEFSRPQSMLIDGNLLYVTDACNHRICVFKTDGAWVRNIGRLGSAPGELRFPYGLDQDSDGHLIVCEFGNNRVQKLDKQTGRGLATWGGAGREPGQLAYPWGVIVDRKDRVIVVDSGNNRLQVFAF